MTLIIISQVVQLVNTISRFFASFFASFQRFVCIFQPSESPIL
nr:MAG TPA: hypothetical protein [Caudoviricetes sp.]